MPTWNTWWGNVLVGLGTVSVLVWAWHDPRSALGRELFWAMLGLNVATAVLLAGRTLLQLPIIEASELGIAVWLYGPYRRPFFAPWKRVRTIVLTQVRGARRARAPVRLALGIGLVQDGQFHLPADLRSAETAAGAEPADLVWSSAHIRGDPRRWVELLQRMKEAYTEAAFTGPTAAKAAFAEAPAAGAGCAEPGAP